MLKKKHWDKGERQSPNFLIAGVMKCGTSSVYDYLIQHPQILPAFEKEPHFLSRTLLKSDSAQCKQRLEAI